MPFGDDPAAYVRQIFLPALAIAVPNTGTLTRVVRTAMVEELDRDYVRTAIGAGIPKRVVVARNVLRNALITPPDRARSSAWATPWEERWSLR